MVPFSYYTLPTSHVTVFLSHSVVPLFFLTFDSTILTLCSTNIICNCTFVTFDSSLFLFFFSHLVIPLFFFSHLIVLSSHCAVPTSHVTVFYHILWYLYFFLTFDGTILTLRSTNIICDYTFVTFGSSFFFSHFMLLSLV